MKHVPIIAFCLIYITICLITYKQFPITADEEYRYVKGKELVNFYQNKNALDYSMANSTDPLESYAYTGFLNIINPKFKYEKFHLENMIAALPIFIATYFLIYAHSKKTKYAILGPVILLFTPSFSGLIPTSVNDVPGATALMISVLLIYLFKDKKTTAWKLVILSGSFAITQTTRISGLMIYPIYLLFTIYYQTFKSGEVKIKGVIKILIEQLPNLIIIFCIANFLMILTWPFIGLNYIRNMYYILTLTTHYTIWNKVILFFGEFISPQQRPWYYLPTYILLTTPIYILILYFSCFYTIKKFWKNSLLILLNIVIVVAITLYLITEPVIYNGLRHFLFLIPLITICAVIKIIEILEVKESRIKKVLVAGIVTGFILVVITIVKLHPYEYAYFNEATGGIKGANNNFETEYWGASYKEASEWVIKYAQVNKIRNLKVYPCNVSYAVAYYSKFKYEVVNKSTEADLILCDYQNDMQRGYTDPIIHTISREGTNLNLIRKVVK